MRTIVSCFALALVCACSKSDTDTYAAGSTQGTTATVPANPVATDQSNAQPDLDLAARIRRALLDDANLTTAGKNVTVVVRSGHATISGAVPTEGEKDRVLAIAGRIVGDDRVKNQLTINP